MSNEMIPRDLRRSMIIRAALDIAETVGFQMVTSEAIARKVHCSDALVRQHFSTLALHDAMMEAAVTTDRLRIIAQGLLARHPAALAAPFDQRVRAAESITDDE